MTTQQTTPTIETMIAETGGGQIAFIRGHVTKDGESRDRKLQIGVSYRNVIQKDLDILKSLDPVALAAHPDMVNPLVRQKGADPIRMVPTAADIAIAIDELIASASKSLAGEHDRKTELVTVVDGRLMRNPKNEDEVLVVGLEMWKGAAAEGTEVKRAETVRTKITTGIKPWVKHTFDLRQRYWRNYGLRLDGSNFDSLVMGGKSIGAEEMLG